MPKNVSALKRLGGPLCLDFTNTVDWRSGPRHVELLNGYTDLLVWSRDAGIVHPERIERLLKEAGKRPHEASLVLKRALRLRGTLYGIFHSLALGAPVNSAHLGILNEEAEVAFRHSRLVEGDNRLVWAWAEAQGGLDCMLGPVVRSATDLATSPAVTRVRECQAEHCGWLFLDTSKNRTRKWCQMSDCGNREKARRHYRKTRKSGGSGA